MAPGLWKTHADPLRGHAAGRDLLDPHPRPLCPILAERHRHIGHRPVRLIAHRHLQRHEHAGRRHSAGHFQPLNGEVARWATALRSSRGVEGTIDEANLRTFRCKFAQERRGVVGRFPLAGAKITHQPHHAGRLRPRTGAEEFGCGRDWLAGPGIVRGGGPGRQFVADLLHHCRRGRAAGNVKLGRRRAAGIGGCQPGKPADGQFLHATGGSQFTANPLHHLPAPVKGGGLLATGFSRAVAHGIAVVEQHHMRGARPTEQLSKGAGPARLGHRQHHAGTRC